MRSVRVVIVNYRTPELTARAAVSALASARAYEKTARGKATVTVVDNSDDGRTADLAELCPGCEVVPTRGNPGFGAGVNAGVALGHEDLVALVNSDAVVEEPFLAELARAFDDPSVGAATALLLLEERGPGGEILVNSTGNVLDSSGNGMDRDWRRPLGSWSAPPQVEGFGGGAAMLRRAALDEVGLFREDLFMYYEDTELSLRLREAGWTIRYVETALAWHGHSGSSGIESPLFAYCNTRNRLLLARRLPLPVRARAWAKSIEGMHDDAADAKNDEELWRGTGKTLDSYADSGLRAAAEHYAELNDATVTSMSVDAAHRQVTVSVRSNSSVEGTDKKMTSTSTAEIVLDKGVCLDHGKVGLVVKGKCQTKAPEPDAGNAPGKKATPSPSPAPSYSPPKGFENHVKISTRLVA